MVVQAKTCPELSVEAVADLVRNNRAVPIDVNPRRRWASGHIPGAVNLDPGEFGIEHLPEYLGTPLVFYSSDAGCGAARYAALRATRLGYENVFIMPAGIRGWIYARMPVEAGR